jgi:hypothetical protein
MGLRNRPWGRGREKRRLIRTAKKFRALRDFRTAAIGDLAAETHRACQWAIVPSKRADEISASPCACEWARPPVRPTHLLSRQLGRKSQRRDDEGPDPLGDGGLGEVGTRIPAHGAKERAGGPLPTLDVANQCMRHANLRGL